MLARYYEAGLGRFLAADPGDDTDPKEPQSWNKYAYVRNNPLKTIDPKGTDGVGIPTSQAQINQMTAMAVAQQLEPQGRAMEAAAQAKTAATAGRAVVEATCDAAPTAGKIANGVTAGLLIAAPFTGGATLPAAGTTAGIAMGADATAFACEPASPERAAALGADLLGAGAEWGTAKVLKEAAPAIAATTKKAVAATTGEVMGHATEPALEKTMEQIKKK